MSPALLLALGDLLQPSGPPALTVYNQGFAVVRETLPLALRPGRNEARFAGATRGVEAESVILRDRNGVAQFQILEQGYRNDPVSQGLLLDLFEGRTIEFQIVRGEQLVRVPGRIVRSGYKQGESTPWGGWVEAQPIVEIDGQLQFGLPGLPLFPELGDDTILEPTFAWTIESATAAAFEAELAYVTSGFSWHADYNAIAPEQGELLDLVGWVTVQNSSGQGFDRAHLKLIAGDVNKVQPQDRDESAYLGRAMAMKEMAAPVSEKSFDEYHLYTLANPVDLADQETKQVEFVRASGIPATRLYVYEGAWLGNQWSGWDSDSLSRQPDYGTQSNPKVWVMREFKNDAASDLGIALPAGRVRFYRQDDDGRLEFTGENELDHTPKDETVRLYTGNAFDVVGERARMDFRVDDDRDEAIESFEIKLRNHKAEAVEVRVVERLYRWVNWEITSSTLPFEKKDSRTIEFKVPVEPDGEVKLSYTVRYTW